MKTIYLEDDTHAKIMRLKYDLGVATAEEVVARLVEKYYEDA